MNKLIAMYSQVLRHESVNGIGLVAKEPWNYGYWEPQTASRAEASENLLRRLLDRIDRRSGRVLDVGIGKGDSTRRLCSIFGAGNVTGINIAPDQVEYARRSGVACELHVMDAVQMTFAPESFDAILAIEAAFHFNTREKFLADAYRLLRPGGRLVMSDLLVRSSHGLEPEVFPTENLVASIDEYRAVYRRAGFPDGSLDIERSTANQLLPLAARLAHEAGVFGVPAREFRPMSAEQQRLTVWFLVTRLLNVAECVIVSATKS